MMKLLFVDNSADLQQTWIEPLRKKGWGVVRARSVEDADRMMTIHGDGLEVIVVNEGYVQFAEKHDIPFVVLTQKWAERDIQKHQNSEHSGIAYLPLKGGMEALYELFQSQSSVNALKSTGTDGVATSTKAAPTLAAAPAPSTAPDHDIALESYSEVLARPEETRTRSQLTLEAPNLVLGGEESALMEVTATATKTGPVVSEVQEIAIEQPAEDSNEGRTVLLNTSQLGNHLNELPLESPKDEMTGAFDINLLKPEAEEKAPEVESVMSLDEIEQVTELPEDFMVNEAAVAAAMKSPLSVESHPDVATLKNYLAMREQDVAVLTGQFRSAQERVKQLDLLLKMEKTKGVELQHMIAKQERRIGDFDQEKRIEFEVLEKHADDLKNQLQDKNDQVRKIEAKLKLTVDEVAKTKERVRVDIRRIRVREKELENQLEIHKKDSTALLQARDEKILELKRKIDLLEFNMELIQEQYQKERSASDELRARLKDAASVMKQAGGFLEQ